MRSEIEAAIDDLICRAQDVGWMATRGIDARPDLAASRARLLALLAPEPSEQEIEAGARAIYDVTWNDDAWHLQDEYYRKSLRLRSKSVLLAARAAQQTGGEGNG